MPTHSLTKPIKITNGRGRISISVTEQDAAVLESVADGESVTTWVHKVAMRVARGLVRKQIK